MIKLSLKCLYNTLNKMDFFCFFYSCHQKGESPFELWAVVLGHVSSFLLVINSSGSCLVYSLLSLKFRSQANRQIRSLKCKRKLLGNGRFFSKIRGVGHNGGAHKQIIPFKRMKLFSPFKSMKLFIPFKNV